MRILLVRHGLTDQTGAVLTGRTAGVHLDERGTEQAASLATRLEGAEIEAVFSSPLERCRETAAPIAKSHGLRVRRDRRFTEVGYGAWTGETLAKLSKDTLWPVVQYRPSLAEFPDGESLVDAQQRIVGGIEDLRRQHTGNVIVSSHADMIKLAVAHYGGTHLDLYQRIVIAPTSLSILRFDAVAGVQLELLNDLGSLDHLGAATAAKSEKQSGSKGSAYREWGHA